MSRLFGMSAFTVMFLISACSLQYISADLQTASRLSRELRSTAAQASFYRDMTAARRILLGSICHVNNGDGSAIGSNDNLANDFTSGRRKALGNICNVNNGDGDAIGNNDNLANNFQKHNGRRSLAGVGNIDNGVGNVNQDGQNVANSFRNGKQASPTSSASPPAGSPAQSNSTVSAPTQVKAGNSTVSAPTQVKAGKASVTVPASSSDTSKSKQNSAPSAPTQVKAGKASVTVPASSSDNSSSDDGADEKDSSDNSMPAVMTVHNGNGMNNGVGNNVVNANPAKIVANSSGR